MSTRKEVRLGDVVEVTWGDTSKTKKCYSTAGYTAYSASGPDGFMPHFDHEGPGIVLSAIGAQCGKTWFATGHWSCIKNTILMKPKDDQVADIHYLYYITKLPEIWPIRGAAQPFISQTDARGIVLRLPEVVVQRRIAGMLSAYDDLIDNHSRRIAILEGMARALYREWFVEFRFPGHEKVKMVESALGTIPEGWTVSPLGDVADVRWGDTSMTKAAYVVEGFPAYSASGMDGRLDHFDFKRDGIVLSAIGANCGKTWYARGRWSCIKNTIRFWSKAAQASTEYLFLVTGDPGYWPRRGAAQPFISLGDARGCPVLCPTENVMEHFTRLVAPMLLHAWHLVERSSRLRRMQGLVLPKLLSGEIDVLGVHPQSADQAESYA